MGDVRHVSGETAVGSHGCGVGAQGRGTRRAADHGAVGRERATHHWCGLYHRKHDDV